MEITRMDVNSFTGAAIDHRSCGAGEHTPGGLDMKSGGTSDGFIALDVQRLSLLLPSYALSPAVVSGDYDSAVGFPAPTLALKGSQRGAEKRPTNPAATDRRESAAVLINVGSEGDAASLPPESASSAGATVAGGGRCRRPAGRRPSPWLHPRRVRVLFATLNDVSNVVVFRSSMGTLILLYFTLSMGKVPESNANAR